MVQLIKYQKIKEKNLVIKAVGDICPGDKYILGLGVLNKTRKYGINFPFNHLQENLSRADLVLGNFEGLLTKRVVNNINSDLTFCGMPDFADAMIDSGFTVVNMANNHTLEHGSDLFIETKSILQKAGIKICGLRSRSKEYYSDPVILSVKDKRVGVLGYNWVGIDKFNGTDSYIAQSRDSIVNYTWKRDRKKNKIEEANKNVITDIKKLKNKVDLVILMAHWGYEFITVPPYNVTCEAKSFIDAGADIIIGGHPHVVQGMEEYKHRLIFYSLGNFIFDRRNKLPRYSTILKIQLEKNLSYENIPCFINKDFQPEHATTKQAEYFFSLIKKSNEIISSKEAKNILNDDKLYSLFERYYRLYKIQSIMHHFSAIKQNPLVIKLILKKISNFFNILIMGVKGNRVRW